MKSNKMIFLLLYVVFAAGCGSGGGSSTPSTNTGGGNSGGSGSSGTTSNILAITVNDPSYPNKPTVSVTVCAPGTSNCQTINNILLDTGDYGLRIFEKTPLTVSLPKVTAGSGSLAECITYYDGSGDWGPVETADVVLGGETASNVPIQVIDATYFASAIPSACKPPNVTDLEENPSSAGFNGSLGVGLFASDCGQGCASSANTGRYFSCSGSSCVGTSVPAASQVQNPVSLLKKDNNGVIVKLPSVPLGGVQSVTGQLILGIGTETNNSPSGMTAYPADINGEFSTVFNSATFSNSFIDSGSNGLFLDAPESLLPPCPSSSLGDGWFCAQPTQTLDATNSGYGGSPSGPVSFQIGDATNLFSSASNSAFVELGGPAPKGSGFDWGLPFFFGRAVFVGIDGTSSTLGSGPYWAY
jgi:hypothetical protein